MKANALLLALLTFVSLSLFGQKQKKATPETDKPKSALNDGTFAGLKWRNIGPAFTSGRIADIAIHPQDENTWYVAVGSGGVWKTENAGVTFTPIFDDQPSYSIGCVTIDPSNPHIVWVGTGENVGGRHVGYGDGVYKSMDGGRSWKNMGLKESEHISKIIVHPENSDVVWVAAQGPLWSSGGERGLYKTTDGGKTWKQVLSVDEWTGVTDLVMDPRDPDRLYAASWQRHRNVAAYMGGGPGSGIWRSTDGGETWEKLSKGLPQGNLGKIGLAISPQNPDILYAAIELNRRKGAVYRSTDRGSSWEKRSDAVSGGTGPHYYQELYASPHHFDRIYLMDVRIQVSDDGGKTFRRLSERDKHSDNHAMAFRPSDPDYLLVGSDGGLYESFDLGQTWRFFDNLPITQYYKVAVDDAEPFYNVFGGTQDNGSHGGPSRTDTRHGIRNADWYKTLGADGHQSATEPGNPNITYAETQQGGLHRIDRITGEQIFIQPQPDAGEKHERYNWDAPILVSPHNPQRLYFASYRVWRSDDRGDNWTPISGDLTRDQERITLPIMGKTWSWDAPWDFLAMSTYNTITSLAESPLQEGLIYAGTDDGLLQVTEDGGQTWRRIEVGSLPGVPATAFVNDIKADLFDANTVYVALDNHKFGDFKPYLLKSTDRGRTWSSIAGDLPDRTLVWRLVQDHVKPELLFVGTEFGVFFTIDGGGKWIKLKGGMPTISIRDLTIQRRENDLVAASFGRGFFILDDYTPLREVSEAQLAQEATLFQPRKAWWYFERSIVSAQGASHYTAPNPPYGAVFTYHLAEGYTTKEAERKKHEKELEKKGEPVTFPGWDAIEEEMAQEKPKVWLTVRDEAGNVVRKIQGPTKKGFHRVAWDLRHASKSAIRLDQPRREEGQRFFGGDRGLLATPGTYTVTLSKEIDGVETTLSEPIAFEVVPLRKGALEPKPVDVMAAYRERVEDLQRETSALDYLLETSKKKIRALETAVTRAERDLGDLPDRLNQLERELREIDQAVNGSPAKREVGEKTAPTIRQRMRVAFEGISFYGPTPLHQRSLEIATAELNQHKPRLLKIAQEDIPELEKALLEAGAPLIEGQMVLPGEEH